MSVPVRFVLVRPRNPNNIGAVARAMANFGLDDLRIVDPHPPVWREAVSAVGAEELLRRARPETIEASLRGCSLVLATMDGRRRPSKPVVPLPSVGAFLEDTLRPGGSVAVLFGSEKTGLTNADAALAHAVLTIPTHPRTPSMNLGHAAALVAYELARRPAAPMRGRADKGPAPTAEQLENLTEKALAAFDRLDYMRATVEDAKRRLLRDAFRRWNLQRKDAALLQAVFHRMSKLEKGTGRG